MAKIIGIDLGTTFSAVAVIKEGESKILENAEGERTTPSVVATAKSGEQLVGRLAKRQQITNPENTVFSIKRLMGRRLDEPEVQKYVKKLPYKVKSGDDGGIQVKMGERWYKPLEISAMILQKLKMDAEQKLGQKIEEAVITCPAYFNDSQRKATKVAGEIAGLKVKRVFNEPTAAALAYGLTKQKGDRKIAVFDLGGGTLDISVLEISEDTVEVIATGGDTLLGGEDFDREVMNWLVDKFKKDEGIDLSKDPLALQRIKEASEKAKIELSSAQETEINLPFVTSDATGPRHLLYKLNRSKLEELVSEHIKRSIKLTKETLKEAKIEAGEINDIILAGGQTRMPKIQEEIKALFGKDPRHDINPDEVVGIGAAVQAGIFQGDVKDVLLLDVTPLSLGIETLGGVSTTLISKNTTIPTKKKKTFSTAANSQTSVEIHVVQGERPMAQDNKTLGRFILEGLPPAPRGMPKIDVEFDIDANGIINVSAKDQATNKSQSIRVEGSSGLSDDEIEKMKKEAEMHGEEDKKKKELAEAKNNAHTLILTAEKSIEELKDKISHEEKQQLEQKIKGLEEIKESGNIEEIKAKVTELSQVLQELGARMYKEAQKAEGSADDNKDKGDKPKAEDGEFEEKKDDEAEAEGGEEDNKTNGQG